jgi:hypothetical protein
MIFHATIISRTDSHARNLPKFIRKSIIKVVSFIYFLFILTIMNILDIIMIII